MAERASGNMQDELDHMMPMITASCSATSLVPVCLLLKIASQEDAVKSLSPMANIYAAPKIPLFYQVPLAAVLLTESA